MMYAPNDAAGVERNSPALRSDSAECCFPDPGVCPQQSRNLHPPDLGSRSKPDPLRAELALRALMSSCLPKARSRPLRALGFTGMLVPVPGAGPLLFVFDPGRD